MPKKYRMTLEQYEEHLRHQVASFFAYWRQEHAKDPKNWPMQQTGTQTSGPLLEWEDQFRAWQDGQD